MIPPLFPTDAPGSLPESSLSFVPFSSWGMQLNLNIRVMNSGPLPDSSWRWLIFSYYVQPIEYLLYVLGELRLLLLSKRNMNSLLMRNLNHRVSVSRISTLAFFGKAIASSSLLKLTLPSHSVDREEQFIVRVPPSVAERVERLLNADPSSPEHKSIWFVFLNYYDICLLHNFNCLCVSQSYDFKHPFSW